MRDFVKAWVKVMNADRFDLISGETAQRVASDSARRLSLVEARA